MEPKRKGVLLDIDDYEISEDEKYLPENVLHQKVINKNLMDAIDKLPPRQKEVIVLYYFQHKKGREIAEALSISASAVKVSLMKAKLNLKRILTEDFELDEKDNYSFIGLAAILGDSSQAVFLNSSTIEMIWKAIEKKFYFLVLPEN